MLAEHNLIFWVKGPKFSPLIVPGSPNATFWQWITRVVNFSILQKWRRFNILYTRPFKICNIVFSCNNFVLLKGFLSILKYLHPFIHALYDSCPESYIAGWGVFWTLSNIDVGTFCKNSCCKMIHLRFDRVVNTLLAGVLLWIWRNSSEKLLY